jgi:cytochrome c-type biogenesis protein CcmE
VSRELGRVQRQKESQPFKFSFSKKKKEDSLSVKYVGDFPFNFKNFFFNPGSKKKKRE